MPFTFNQVNAMPDIAANNRFKVYFPTIQGNNFNTLGILVHSITIPQKAVGHIQVRLQDQSIGFRGGRQFDNQMQITFYENVAGEALGSIETWMSYVRSKEGTSLRKPFYSGEGKLEIYDTVGYVIHTLKLRNMFPITIEYPVLDEGGSAAMEFTTTFNVDYAELDNAV